MHQTVPALHRRIRKPLTEMDDGGTWPMHSLAPMPESGGGALKVVGSPVGLRGWVLLRSPSHGRPRHLAGVLEGARLTPIQDVLHLPCCCVHRLLLH